MNTRRSPFQQAQSQLSQVADLRSQGTACKADGLLRVVDGCFLGIIFVAPLFMGGRHPLGRLVLVVLAVTLTVAWFLRQRWKPGDRWFRVSAGWILLAGGALVTLQGVPLPTNVLRAISPHHTELLPLWTTDTGAPIALGDWTRLSLVPEATRAGLIIYLTYVFVFVVTVQRVRDLNDVERFLKWIALATLGLAALGLLQYLVPNDKFLWVYEHPFRIASGSVRGSFINRNHFAHQMALGIGPLALWTVTPWRREKLLLRHGGGGKRWRAVSLSHMSFPFLILLGFVLFAGLMTFSRGGIMVMALSLIIALSSFLRASLVRWQHVAVLVVVVMLVMVALSIHGFRRVAHRLDDFTSGSIDTLDSEHSRRTIWMANLATVRDFPWLGTGIGSHREVHPSYRRDASPVEYTHAENGYLQVASESGLTGLLLLFAGIGLCTFWCLSTFRRSRSHRVVACMGAVGAGLAASLVHSLCDFVWYLPACMSWTVLLAALALRLSQLSRPEVVWVGRFPGYSLFGRMGFVGLIGALGLWMTCDHWSPALASSEWDQYLRTSIAAAQRKQARLQQGAPDLEILASDATACSESKTKLAHLRAVVDHYPGHARAHARLAGQYLERFAQEQLSSINAMDINQIRDAAIASKFSSAEELKSWLQRSCGVQKDLLYRSLWHAHRAVDLCPLQAEAYVYLGQLCFLENGQEAAKSYCVNQALRLRPHQGDLLLAAGREAILSGDMTRAIQYWKECFHSGDREQWQLIKLLSRQVSPMFFVESFQPDIPAVRRLYACYEENSRPEDLQALCRYGVSLAEQLSVEETSPEAKLFWLWLRGRFHELKQPWEALSCAEKASVLAPNDFDVRYALGRSFWEVKQVDEAKTQLRWCIQRRPEHQGVRSLMNRAIRSRVQNQARAVSFDEASDLNH